MVATARTEERGFTLIEFMIAAAITITVLGGTVLLAAQLQRAYTTDLNDTSVEQEVRFALDWITRALRSAGSDPYDLGSTSPCPAAGTPFQPIQMDDLNENGAADEIRIQADLTGTADGAPDGKLGGDAGSCSQDGEDITIAYDSVARTITILDNNTDASARTMTEPVIAGLAFTYYDSTGAVTVNPNLVSYVKVTVRGQWKARNANDVHDVTLEAQVRIRTR